MDLKLLRHSAAHLLAQAVTELFPGTKLTIGPVTEEGFFYDFLPVKNFKEDDLVLIESKMHEIVKRNLPITQKDISKQEACKLYKDNQFKLELIEDIEGDTVGLSIQGDFYDLCKGGHVESTGLLDNFKLTGISGSYWRAIRTNQPLQRISGIVFATKEDLLDYNKRMEDAEKYDHRRLGKDLDLFSFHDEGPGFPFYHPKGRLILNTLMQYMRSILVEENYQEISTPIMLSEELWIQSGHYKHYKDNMYFSKIDEKVYAIKPMNCPGAILIYKTRPRSYRELPLRLAEFGLDHRHELSGVLHGLMRVRSFTQDDAHLFCSIDQVGDEVSNLVKIVFKVMNKFGFEKVKVALSTRPSNFMGDIKIWDQATQALRDALDKAKIDYAVKEGDGAFYGPKIDFSIEDSMKRQWQCGTIQVDFFLPENFDVNYIGSDGKQHRVVMIHRAVLGSLERFFAVLLEHHKGNLPFWLAPVQVKILTITDKQKEYANNIYSALKKAGIRVEMDYSGEQLSAQIKTAQLEKVPWMLVIGDKEETSKTITLRHRSGEQEKGITLEKLIDKALGDNQ